MLTQKMVNTPIVCGDSTNALEVGNNLPNRSNLNFEKKIERDYRFLSYPLYLNILLLQEELKEREEKGPFTLDP